MVNIFIGYDPKEISAYHVLSHSLIWRATEPLSITPLARSHLQDIYQRPRGPLESTDFSLTRFLVPYLSGYRGFSLYLDCDMLCRTDIVELLDRPLDTKSVWVCPHDYTPKDERKMDDQIQTQYPRKNWSSMMLFNNSKCWALTPEYVNQAPALDLHRFAWAQDSEIGHVPLEWNWLVGEYEANPGAKMLHYTLGGPWLPDYRKGDHVFDWVYEYQAMLGYDPWPMTLSNTTSWEETPGGHAAALQLRRGTS